MTVRAEGPVGKALQPQHLDKQKINLKQYFGQAVNKTKTVQQKTGTGVRKK